MFCTKLFTHYKFYRKLITLLTIFLCITQVYSQRAGQLDESFNSIDTGFGNPTTGVFDGAVYSIARQSDQKFILGGGFTAYNNIGRNGILRINEDGSIDESFNPGSGVGEFDPFIFFVAIQPDGKIIAAGDFETYNGVSRNSIVRINTDGSLDATFNPGTGSNNEIWTIAIQSDGKILIGGWFTIFNGTPVNYIARLNTDGTLDGTFNTGTGPGSAVLSIALQPDNKIIIGGVFTSVDGVGRNRIARLNADGSLDTSFNPGSGANNALINVSIASNGKIYMAGNFTEINGVARQRIARLNEDGTLDTSFSPSSGLNGQPRALALQTDGKILVGGQFTSYNGVARSRIVRINTDGSLDTSFDPGTGFNAGSIILSVRVLSQTALISGDFTSYNGIGRNGLVRISLEDMPFHVADSLALVSLYNSTNGTGWTNKSNWLSGAVYDWFGIGTQINRVRSINLPGNGLNGTLPAELSDFDNLQILNVSNNNISGSFPANLSTSLQTLNISNNDFTGLPSLVGLTALTSVDVRNNRLTYKDLQPNVGITGFLYAPQKSDSIQPPVNATTPVGSSYDIVITDNTPGNVFTWSQNGAPRPDLTTGSFTIPALNRNTMGDYTCVISNASVPGLSFNYSNRVLATATVSGTLFDEESIPVNTGAVELYAIRSTGGYLKTDSIPVAANGTFTFNEVVLDDYVLLGTPGEVQYPNLLPTWFEQSFLWEEADTIVLEDNITDLDILSVKEPTEPLTGPGILFGYFEEDLPEGRTKVRGRVRSAGVAVRRVERAGRPQDDELILVAFTFTDENGEFSIEGLPLGTYRLNIQYPGYPMDETSFVEFIIGTGVRETKINVEALVVNNKIRVRQLLITGMERSESYKVNVYPNPASDKLTLEFEKEQPRRTVIILDSSGRKLKQFPAEERDVMITVRDLPAASYILSITEGKRSMKTIRVLIKD